MIAAKVSESLGRGAQLFRVRDPKKHFVEIAELGPLPDFFIGRRRVWKAKEEDAWYALLTIPYKDEEEILVRAVDANWVNWDWKAMAAQADACRWRGPTLDSRYVL